MERFTIRNSDGSVSQPTNMNWADALDKLADYEDTCLAPEDIQKAVDLLESVSPLRHPDVPKLFNDWIERCTWHVRKCDELYSKLREYEDGGFSPERVKELGQAETEDRLVILPCELGATVWVISSNRVAPYTVNSFVVHPGKIFLICENPKFKGFSRICSWRETCFPTLAEAERFLEAKK